MFLKFLGFSEFLYLKSQVFKFLKIKRFLRIHKILEILKILEKISKMFEKWNISNFYKSFSLYLFYLHLSQVTAREPWMSTFQKSC